MWNKTLNIEFRKDQYQIVLYLDNIDDTECVIIRSMLNEYYLIQKIIFEQRDDAYLFIQCFNEDYAKLFFESQAYSTGAIE